jgi:hypothetical protein
VDAQPQHFAYLFEAKGIQRWVLEGDRLRDVAAASALLDWTARGPDDNSDDLLGQVLELTELSPTGISRRAGGAFVLHFREDELESFDRFWSLWRLAFMRLLPGLEFQEGLGAAPDPLAARDAAFDPANRISLGREGGSASLLPLSHPLGALCQRTGAPGVHRYRESGEIIDQVTLAKRRARALADGVGKRLEAGLGQAETLSWPTMFERDPADRGGIVFPLRDDDWIAVVHADISALGAFYKAVRDAEPEFGALREASAGIEAAVLAAARRAMRDVVLPEASGRVMPARPILIGGDDITLIVRGDLAIPFVASFLSALEEETERTVGVGLTGGAGVAFGGVKQPFYRLLRLAESLAGYAKAKAKAAAGQDRRPPSVLAFHRVTETALATTAKTFLEDRYPAGCQPYELGACKTSELADFAGLAAVRNALDAEDLRPGGLRAIRSELAQGRAAEADEAWARWRRMALGRLHGKDALERLDAALSLALSAAGPFDSLRMATGPAGGFPLFDAIEWRAVG